MKVLPVLKVVLIYKKVCLISGHSLIRVFLPLSVGPLETSTEAQSDLGGVTADRRSRKHGWATVQHYTFLPLPRYYCIATHIRNLLPFWLPRYCVCNPVIFSL